MLYKGQLRPLFSIAPRRHAARMLLLQHPREQLCMNAVAVNYTNGEIAVVDSDLWRGLDGQWIVHGYESRAPTWFLGEVTKSFAYLLHNLNPDIYDIIKQWPSLNDNTTDPPWSTHPGRTWR